MKKYEGFRIALFEIRCDKFETFYFDKSLSNIYEFKILKYDLFSILIFTNKKLFSSISLIKLFPGNIWHHDSFDLKLELSYFKKCSCEIVTVEKSSYSH